MARALDIVVSFSFHFILLLPSLKLCISYFRVVQVLNYIVMRESSWESEEKQKCL